MPAMRDAAARRPAVLAQHFLGAEIFDEAIGKRRVHLQIVAVGTQSAVANQVPRVLHREQIFAGRERSGIARRQSRVQQVVQRIDRLLVPVQLVRRDGIAKRNRFIKIENGR